MACMAEIVKMVEMDGMNKYSYGAYGTDVLMCQDVQDGPHEQMFYN